MGKNIVSVVSVFLSKSLHLPKPCLRSYKIGSIILCILGWYGPCEVLDVTPAWSQDVDVLDCDFAHYERSEECWDYVGRVTC